MTGIGLVRATKVTTRTGPANRMLMGASGPEWKNVPFLFEIPDPDGDDHVRGRSFLIANVEMINLDQPVRGFRIHFEDRSVDPVEISVEDVVTVHHVDYTTY